MKSELKNRSDIFSCYLLDQKSQFDEMISTPSLTLLPDLLFDGDEEPPVVFSYIKDIAASLTCTLLSGRLIFMAISSLMKMSGYFVLVKSSSNSLSCALVKVVLSRRCFLGGPLKNDKKG